MFSLILKRTVAYGLFGCMLLLIYQIVFMTRTSASRDWNHLHSNKFSLPSVQRFVLHNISESRISDDSRCLSRGELSLPSTFMQMRSPYNPLIQKNTGFIHKVSCDGEAMSDSPHWQVFAIDLSSAKSFQNIPNSEVFAVQFDNDESVDDLVDQAISSNKRALIYIVPAGWVPNFGLKIYKIPVWVVHRFPNKCRTLSFDIARASSEYFIPSKWVIPGFTYEKVIIGNCKISPETTAAFLEVSRVFQQLSSLGWKPLRTIEFVMIPRYGANEYVRKYGASLQENGVVYIDSSELDASNRISASPTLFQISDWAVKQLLDAGLISQRQFKQVFSAGFGSNTFLFDLQISSISVSMATPINQARVLALILATMSQDAILPLRMKDYASFIPEQTNFGHIASLADQSIENLREAFTREHPWYELTAKIKILSQRKRVNLVMSQIERSFVDGRGKHAIFANDVSGTRTVVNKSKRERAAVAAKVSEKLLQLL